MLVLISSPDCRAAADRSGCYPLTAGLSLSALVIEANQRQRFLAVRWLPGQRLVFCSRQTPLRFLINNADGLTRDTSRRLALAVNYGPREPDVCGDGAGLALTPSKMLPRESNTM